MRKDGFTLLEVMIVASVLGMVSVTLYYLDLAMVRSALYQESITRLRDEGRLALQYMARHIRMAESATLVSSATSGNPIPLGTAAVTELAFTEVTDADGDGWPTAPDFAIEQTNLNGFATDDNDMNSDGLSTTQLLHLREDDSGGVNVVRILTSKIRGTGGVAFRRAAGGVQVTLVLDNPGRGLRPPTTVTLNQVISTRN